MSRVGPITPVAAQLVGQTADNLNQSADRRLQLLALKSRERMANESAKLERELSEAQLSTQEEIAAKTQEGFEAQRASTERITEVEQKGASERQTKELEARQTLATDLVATEQKALAEREERRNLREDARVQLELQLGQASREEATKLRGRMDEIDFDIAERDARMMELQTTIKILDGTLNGVALVQMRTAAESLQGGLTQTRLHTLSKTNRAVQIALEKTVGVEQLNKDLSAALKAEGQTPKSIAIRFVDSTIDELVNSGVLSHTQDEAQAAAALKTLTSAMLREIELNADPTAFSPTVEFFNVPDGKEATDIALEEAKKFIDDPTIFSVIRGMSRSFDFRSKGTTLFEAETLQAQHDSLSERLAKAKVGNKQDREKFDKALDMSAAMDASLERLDLKTFGEQGENAANIVSNAVVALQQTDPVRFAELMEEMRANVTDEQFKSFSESLIEAKRTLESRVGATEEQKRIRQQLRLLAEEKREEETKAAGVLREKEAGLLGEFLGT